MEDARRVAGQHRFADRLPRNGLETLHAVAARPAPRTVIAPALNRLAGSTEAAKPAEEEPIRDQSDRDPDPGPHRPASVVGRGRLRRSVPAEDRALPAWFPTILSKAPAGELSGLLTWRQRYQ